MKKLDENQVEKLYKFTSRHYVKYYDVQTELVDHLASGIEEQWREDPEITFENALQKEFRKFGVYGFSDVLGKRQWAMEKRYFKIIWRESILLLKDSKILGPVVLLFILSYQLLSFETGSTILFLTFFILVIGLLLKFHIKMQAITRKMEKGERVYLLEAVMSNTGSFFSVIWLPFHILNLTSSYGNFYWQLLMSFLITMVAFAGYVCYFYLPKKKEEILLQAHPEIKFLQ
ncbi:MAG: hypothetical protein WBL21_04630 [Salinimicrobium sp.]